MRHNNSAFMAVSREPNDTTYQKTMALNDFYLGSDDWEYPLGGIQTLGKSHGAVIKAEALPHFLSLFPDVPFDALARHAGRLLADDGGSAAAREPDRTQIRRPCCADRQLREQRGPGAYDASWRRCSPRSTSTRTCSSARFTSARTCRSAAPRTRRAPCGSEPTRHHRCSTRTARRTNSTTFM